MYVKMSFKIKKQFTKMRNASKDKDEDRSEDEDEYDSELKF